MGFTYVIMGKLTYNIIHIYDNNINHLLNFLKNMLYLLGCY